MKTLYFDIDGTVLRESEPKPALANGVFERAVRQAGFQRLVCTSQLIHIILVLQRQGHPVDPPEMVLGICRGVFADESWFRQVISIVEDPDHRASQIDLNSDWYYVDDLGAFFMEQDGLASVFAQERGRRVFIPDPDGDGQDVLDWLETLQAE